MIHTTIEIILLVNQVIKLNENPDLCNEKKRFWVKFEAHHFHGNLFESVADKGLGAVQANWCETCTLTVYSSENQGVGKVAEYSFRDGSEFEFPFCVKSFDLSCEQLGGGEEEQEEVQILFEFLDENEINTPKVTEIVNTGFTEAVGYLKGDGTLPAGQYQIVNIISVERSTNFDDTYRLTLDISDGQGNDFVAIIMVVDDPSASPYAVYWEAAPK